MRNSKKLALGRVALLFGLLAPGWGLCRFALGGHRDLFTVALYFWILVATRACWRWLGPREGADLACRPGWWNELANGAAIGLAMLALQCALMELGGCWHPVTLGLWIWVGMLVKALPLALAEEYLFRGYLFGGYLASMSRAPAYATTCTLFALSHLFRRASWDHRLGLAVGLFLASAALCRLVEVSGSLWPAVGVHTVWIAATAVVPPASITPGILGGLEGDVGAGLVSWALLFGLYALAPSLAARSGPAHSAPAEAARP